MMFFWDGFLFEKCFQIQEQTPQMYKKISRCGKCLAASTECAKDRKQQPEPQPLIVPNHTSHQLSNQKRKNEPYVLERRFESIICSVNSQWMFYNQPIFCDLNFPVQHIQKIPQKYHTGYIIQSAQILRCKIFLPVGSSLNRYR